MEGKHLPDCKRIDNGLCDIGMNESNFVWVDLGGSEQKQERVLDVYCGDKWRVVSVEGHGVPKGDDKQGYLGYL